jgi:hypothetical protein
MPAPLLIISIVGLPPIVYIVFGNLYNGHYSNAGKASVGLILWLLIYILNKGSKIAWDQERIYERPSGFGLSRRFPWVLNTTWLSLRYDEIASMDAVTINDPSARSVLLPFQLLRLTTADGDEKRYIWLYSLAIRDKELAPLLRHMDAKCPNMLPAIVRKRLAKWADNDS